MRCLFWGLLAWLLAVPVAFWGWFHERRILRLGRPLSALELEDARRIGVREPEKVRVLAVSQVPNPVEWLCRALEKCSRFRFFAPAGLTLRHGIFVEVGQAQDRALIDHELVHTMQYERAGGLFAFLGRYLFQCMTDGYVAADWEREAREVSGRLLW